MTEREMLEAAARAMGLTGYSGEDWIGAYFCVPADWSVPRSEPVIYRWGTEDSDSFRLAAALRISVEHNDPCDNRPFVSAECCNRVGRVERFIEDVPDESKRADRMRLAILRCAAAQPPKEVA